MKKRIFSLFCVFVLLMSLLPIQTLAYVGPIRTTEEERAAVTSSRMNYGGVQYLVLQNDYLTVAVQATGSGSSLRSYTVPTAQLGSNNDIFRFSSETNRFYLGDQEGFQNARQLQIKGLSAQVEDQADGRGKCINVSITFNDSRLVANMYVWMERVNKGEQSGTTTEQGVYKDLSEGGNHWCVVADTTFQMTDTSDFHTSVGYPHHVKEYPLSAMGHRNASTTAPLMMGVAEETWKDDPWFSYQKTDFYSQNITSGLGYSKTENRVEYEVPVEGVSWTRTKGVFTHYTEIYTENYLAANPFVGLSGFNNDALSAGNSHGVEGHHWILPDYVSSDGRTVTTYSSADKLWNVDFQHIQTVTSLWGFRDLYAEGDVDAPTQPDQVEVELTADKLAILRASSGELKVQPYDGDQGLEQVKAAFPGYTHIATFRGDYKTTTKVDLSDNSMTGMSWGGEKDGGNTTYTYEFTGQAVALSPTVTATWGSGGSFSITSDGKITQSGLSLNAPTFKFYAPQNGGGLTLGFDANGVTMSFEPEKNSAIFSLDIPYATTMVRQGYADMTGNLRFTGEMGISTIFDGASFNMEELGYGLKNGTFTVNGVRASGSFETAKLIGMDLAEVEGSINTFDGEESYAFDLQLDLFSLVKAKAELELKRLKSDGALIPDDLYLYIGGSALPVLTVVPTVPVAQITDGGLGFYNLADTINGDYYAIPPITMRGTVKGKYVQLFTGTTDTVLGPGTYEFTASDIKIAGMESLKIIDEAGLGLYIGGQRVNYRGTDYSGIRFSGQAHLVAGLPSVSKNWLKLNSGVSLGLFGGLNDAQNSLYVQASGNSHISAEFQFPDSWDVIGGMNLLGAGVDIVVGGQTVIPVSGSIGNGFSGAFNNMKLYMGAMGQASLLGCNARVWVILPKSAATGDWWGYTFKVWKSLPGWSWEGKIQGLSTASRQAAPALQNLSALPSTSQTVPVNVTSESDGAYLAVAFDPSVTQEQLKEHLKVTDPAGKEVALNWLAVDGNNNITNADTANIFSGVVSRSDGTGSDHVAVIYLGKGTGYNGNYTVTTGDAASAQTMARNSTDLSFTAQFAAVNVELDGLGPVNFNGNTVTGSVDNPESGVTYVVRTYLSQEKDGADYLVGEQIVENGAITVSVPTTGTAAPSGSYYVTTYLMRQEAQDLDGDGTVEADEIALLGIGNASSTSQVAYTNTTQPGQVQTVTLTATGNETMRATWSPVSDADGYRITIYNADGTDTGLGYEYDVSQFSGDGKMPGLNLEDGMLCIDMAMTAGGATSQDGTPITLDAGKEYKVGVTAYRSETTGEQTAKYYGTETQSEAQMLSEYTPLDMTILVNGVAMTADDNGIYHAIFQDTENDLTVEAPDGVTATFTVTRTDTGEELTKTGYGAYLIPNVDGTLMLAVTGSVTNGTATDTTTRYVLFSQDSTAPVITLDEEVFYVDPSTHTYTVTGITDPGATVAMAGEADEWDDATLMTTTAAADGSFSLSGTMAPNGSMMRSVTVTDEAGNETSTKVMIVLLSQYTVHFDANGGSGTMPDETATFGASYTLPTCTFTPPQGKRFQAWAMGKDDTTVYQPGDSVVLDADTTFYALWEDIPHTHVGQLQEGFAATCVSPGQKDYYTCSCQKYFEDEACTREIVDLEAWKAQDGDGYIAPLGHSYGSEWKYDADNHWHECTCGEKTDVAAHSGGTATCVQRAACDICGMEYGQLGLHDWNAPTYTWTENGSACTAVRTCNTDPSHREEATATVTSQESKAPTCTEMGETTYTATFAEDWAEEQTKTVADLEATGHTLTKTEYKAATCTEAGNRAYWTCETCNKVYEDETGTTEIALADTVIPATGHTLTKTEAKDPTCTEAGNRAYWTCETCNKVYEDEAGTTEITLNDTVLAAVGHGTTELQNEQEATCTKEGYTGDKVCTVCGEILEKGEAIHKLDHHYIDGTCTVCGATDTGFRPEIIAGANGTWQKGSEKGYSVTSSAAYSDFQKIQVDGKDLSASHYTVEEGSTVVTLKASYLETLSVGKHTLSVVSQTGTATTNFTIQAAPAAEDTQSPQTGEGNEILLWMTLLAMAGAGLCVARSVTKKRSGAKH